VWEHGVRAKEGWGIYSSSPLLGLYSPNLREGVFSEVRRHGVLRSLPRGFPNVGTVSETALAYFAERFFYVAGETLRFLRSNRLLHAGQFSTCSV
jgi:hypothetical protein